MRLPPQTRIVLAFENPPEVVGPVVGFIDEVPAGFEKRTGLLHLGGGQTHASETNGPSAGLNIPKGLEDINSIGIVDAPHQTMNPRFALEALNWLVNDASRRVAIRNDATKKSYQTPDDPASGDATHRIAISDVAVTVARKASDVMNAGDEARRKRTLNHPISDVFTD